MAKDKLNDDTVYVCTYGFVAGLPAECSMKQARDLGLEGELQAAIENGNYVAAATTQPQAPSLEGKGSKKEK